MKKEELKPCPFCGGKVEVKWTWANATDKVYGVYGHKNGCYLDWQSHKFRSDTKEEATKSWNTRDLSQITIDEGEVERILKQFRLLIQEDYPIKNAGDSIRTAFISGGESVIAQALKKADIWKVEGR